MFISKSSVFFGILDHSFLNNLNIKTFETLVLAIKTRRDFAIAIALAFPSIDVVATDRLFGQFIDNFQNFVQRLVWRIGMI